jgi:hypothetical protein
MHVTAGAPVWLDYVPQANDTNDEADLLRAASRELPPKNNSRH